MTIVSIATLPAFGLGPAQAVSGQDVTPNIKWHTGRDLDQFNEFSISALWSDAQLRDRLSAFAGQQKAAIFLDRRVDPSAPINIGMNTVTPEQFLWAVGEKCNLGVCRVDDFYYFGPPKSAAELPVAIQALAKQTTRKRRSSKVNWADIKPLKTDPAVEPKQVLQNLATENSFRIKNLDAIPHDLWSGFELPPTRLDTRVAVILVGFDKWFVRSKDGTEIEIVDFPLIESGEIVFGNVSEARQSAKRYKPRFPGLKITATGKRLRATGPPLKLAALNKALVKDQTAVTGENLRKSFTLTTTASRGSILASIAKQTNLQLEFDQTNAVVQKALQEPIEIRLKEASFDELLAETLKGANLRYQSVDGRLKITQQ